MSFIVHARTTLGFAVMLVFYMSRLNAAPLESGFASTSSAYDARSRVLATAGKYEKTPYRYGGTDRKGLDCSGLIYVSFQEALGIAVPRNTTSLYSWVERIPLEKAQPGDLVFFNTTGTGKVSHVGIFIGDGQFIHAASEGPDTGVIYSRLDERYWSRTYAGVGRALPETNMSGGGRSGNSSTGSNIAATAAEKSLESKQGGRSSFLIGFAAAPTWNTYFTGDNIIRGVAGQFRVGAEVKPFGLSMIFGMELRSEWDNALGIFRLPLTLSWGLDDKVRFFAGPVLSFGNAAISVPGEDRTYTGGTTWFGAAGVTIAPTSFIVAGNELAPYGELAWQSYSNNNADSNFGADFAAGFRFSTGLRYTWRM